jgi:broad specificity phosphatase PhoE
LKLILVRHAETDWNKERRIQGGGSDTGLSDLGVKQARQLASYFQNEDIAAVCSSPLKRAYDTATYIAKPHEIEVKADDRLKEIHVGDLEGISWASLGNSFSQFLLQKWQGAGKEKLPGGESFVDLQDRTWSCMENLRESYNGGTAVVVSHYFATLAIIFKALDLLPEYLPKFRIANGGISIIEYASYGPRLTAFNNTAFIDCEEYRCTG